MDWIALGARPTPKRYERGTHRAVSPAETVASMRPFLCELGITRVANVTGLDVVDIPTVMVVRPNGRSLSVHQGKGVDLDAARASGIMEATEHHLAEHIDRPLLLATARELEQGRPVIDVSKLPGFVRAFGPHEQIMWIEGEDLAKHTPLWVPYELVHLNLTLPLPPRHGFFPLGSNGLASGNNHIEALIHGLCELIERDALALFYQESMEAQASRRVDASTVDDEVCVELLERYRRAAVDVGIWDVTSDLGVASFLCMVVDREYDPFRPMAAARGSGSHPDRVIALARALTEAAQSRLTRIAGSRDDLRPDHLVAERAEESAALARAQLGSPVASMRRYEDIPTRRHDSLDEDLDWLQAQLEAWGMPQVVGVDLSRPGLPCSVMRVLVPGLEGVSEAPGYRPGKRALGRRATLP